MARVCRKCGTKLNRYHKGNYCYACQDKRLEEIITDDKDFIDAKEFAHILGLSNVESVRRLGRKGKLPKRIPGIREYRWPRSVVEEWIKQGGFGNKEFRTVARGIASNLRKCYNDPVIRAPSNEIGSKVYGEELVIGMTATGTGPIELAKIDKSVAMNMLKQLPREEFPEITSIIDWANLPYDKITEDFIVRLESYY
jgi:predicted DNA-binding transcriptional regulator AlpA